MSQEMTKAETVERFMEGMAMASARARELGALQFQPTWGTIADSLDLMRKRGESMIRGKALTKDQVAAEINRYKGIIS